ncbi:MAG: FecR family protein [Chitinophagaceae bacterium]
MSQENYWVLLSKKLSGEASIVELKELENLILEHPDWQYALQNLEDLWKHQSPKNDLQAEDAYMLHLHRMKEMNISFGDALEEMPFISSKKTMQKWYWAAAALFIMFSLFAIGTLFNIKEKKALSATSEINEVSTRQGSKSKIQLPDGSVVWLNAGSKLTYNKEYGQQIREVSLTGEGYFDIIKNKEKPFIIHTSNIDIKVLGTAFNVRAYPEDKQTETILIRGSIEVTIKNRPDNKIILSPNEKLIVENESFIKKGKDATKAIQPAISINKLIRSIADSTVAETQWVDNKLVFNDESFAELAVRMERWYDINIEITDPLLEQKRMTGNFEKETINQAIEALKLMIPFKHEQAGNKINIHR